MSILDSMPEWKSSPFTDDDLKRLKDLTNNSQISNIPLLQDNDKVAALLARLEAAEKLAETVEEYSKFEDCGWCIGKEDEDGMVEHQSNCPLMAEIKAWRTTKGEK